VRTRLQPRQLTLLVALLTMAAVGLAVGAVIWFQGSRTYDAARLLSALPEDPAVQLYVDAGALRAGGILDLIAGSQAMEEADYRKFVDETSFDYRKDLDAVAGSFASGAAYFTVRGRFHWNRLNAYAESQGGKCTGVICTMAGSAPGRNISFFPLQANVLALAVSPDPAAARRIGPGQGKATPPSPAAPVWMSVPPAVFESMETFPSGTRSFLSPLARASRVTFAAAPKGNDIELQLEVICATPEAAADLAKQLSDATGLLKKMLARDRMTPNLRDLSGVLVAGNFQQRQNRVLGTWPIDRGFVAALAGGQVQ
jgi:hypothetical protein